MWIKNTFQVLEICSFEKEHVAQPEFGRLNNSFLLEASTNCSSKSVGPVVHWRSVW